VVAHRKTVGIQHTYDTIHRQKLNISLKLVNRSFDEFHFFSSVAWLLFMEFLSGFDFFLFFLGSLCGCLIHTSEIISK